MDNDPPPTAPILKLIAKRPTFRAHVTFSPSGVQSLPQFTGQPWKVTWHMGKLGPLPAAQF